MKNFKISLAFLLLLSSFLLSAQSQAEINELCEFSKKLATSMPPAVDISKSKAFSLSEKKRLIDLRKKVDELSQVKAPLSRAKFTELNLKKKEVLDFITNFKPNDWGKVTPPMPPKSADVITCEIACDRDFAVRQDNCLNSIGSYPPTSYENCYFNAVFIWQACRTQCSQ